MRVDGLCPYILLGQIWALETDWNYQILHTSTHRAIELLDERHLLSCIMWCSAFMRRQAQRRVNEMGLTHTSDTKTQLDYTLCLSATITPAVLRASQRWTEASHFCDTSSGLDVNESLIEMQTHSLYFFSIWVCVSLCPLKLVNVISSSSHGLASNTCSLLIIWLGACSNPLLKP